MGIKALYCNRCAGPLSVVAIVIGELGLENDIDEKMESHSRRQHSGVSEADDFYWSNPFSKNN